MYIVSYWIPFSRFLNEHYYFYYIPFSYIPCWEGNLNVR
jgi:hypothetical protein